MVIKSLVNIVNAAVLAIGMSMATSACEPAECCGQDTESDTYTGQDTDICSGEIEPVFDFTDVSVDMEILEERVITLGEIKNPVEGTLQATFNGTCDPFICEVTSKEIDFESTQEGKRLYELKITAPEFPLMPTSDYITNTGVGLDFCNECSCKSISVYMNMLYGCASIDMPLEEWGGAYYGTIIGSRYKQNTGIDIETGDKIHFSADGTICWSKFDGNTCQGIKQVVGLTWGGWGEAGGVYYALKENLVIDHQGPPGELSFIIPDGARPEDFITSGDEMYCVDDYYKDSGGEGYDIMLYIE
jgi:hypothetical protein